MKALIRRITNISEQTVAIDTKQHGFVYLLPGESIENVSVRNLKQIKPYVKIIRNLNE